MAIITISDGIYMNKRVFQMFQRIDPCKRIKKWNDRSIGLMWQFNIDDRAGLWLVSSRYGAIDSEFPWEWLVNYFQTVERLNNCISILFGRHKVLLEKHAQTIHIGKR